MLDHAERRHGLRPSTLRADKGYDAGAFLVALEKRWIRPHVAKGGQDRLGGRSRGRGNMGAVVRPRRTTERRVQEEPATEKAGGGVLRVGEDGGGTETGQARGTREDRAVLRAGRRGVQPRADAGAAGGVSDPNTPNRTGDSGSGLLSINGNPPLFNAPLIHMTLKQRPYQLFHNSDVAASNLSSKGRRHVTSDNSFSK